MLEDADQDLVRRIADGDASACRALIDRHLPGLHAMSTRITGSAADADEICQDTFLRAWQQAGRWQPGRARFSTWLHQVALNLCRDRLRARREQQPLDSLPEGAHLDTPERQAGADERSAAIRNALGKLPERQREALVLSHFQGWGNTELATLLELSVDALESLLARARRGLREHLEEYRMGKFT